jgi:hypothetical protein
MPSKRSALLERFLTKRTNFSAFSGAPPLPVVEHMMTTMGRSANGGPAIFFHSFSVASVAEKPWDSAVSASCSAMACELPVSDPYATSSGLVSPITDVTPNALADSRELTRAAEQSQWSYCNLMIFAASCFVYTLDAH